MRVTRSVTRREWKKDFLKDAKGFRGRKKNCYGLAVDMVIRKFKYMYRDRRKKKSQMRSLWIVRLGAAARQIGLSYSQFIHKTKTLGLNRKTLSELAIRDMESFKTIVSSAINK